MAKSRTEREEEEERAKFFKHVLLESSDLIPDIGIETCESDYKLAIGAEYPTTKSFFDKYIRGLTLNNVKDLGSAVADLFPNSNLINLATTIISITQERYMMGKEKEENKWKKEKNFVIVAQEEERENKCMFAEEKASGVRDTMEEYLKRLGMYFLQPTRALGETERLEKQLSEQLTRLKNSMLHDNQMSSRSMKHWTNGAAFHLEMLIHAARLEMQSTEEDKLEIHKETIRPVLNCYDSDLQELLKHYKTYKKSSISLSVKKGTWELKDNQLKKEPVTGTFKTALLKMENISEDYVDYMFNNCEKLKKLNCYFRNLWGNLPDQITGKEEFSMDDGPFYDCEKTS